MLLQFTVENFQSIKNRTSIDMVSVQGKGISEFKDSLIKDRYLPVTAIYGPNGGGKTTLLRAFQTLQFLIGAHFNQIGGIQLNRTLLPIPVSPFKFDKECLAKPTIFEVQLEIKGIEYLYGISILNNQIIEEFLLKKGFTTPIFERVDQKLSMWSEMANIVPGDIVSKVAPGMPFVVFIKSLYTGFSAIDDVINWFLTTFYVDYNSPFQEQDLLNNIYNYSRTEDKGAKVKVKILEMLKNMGIQITDYEVKETPARIIAPSTIDFDIEITTMHTVGTQNFKLPLPAESNGTQKIFSLVPLFIASLETGRAIFIDELDAKLHPKLLEFIVKLYTCKETNPKGAQLIFTSHELTTMNNKVFRRDEIYFIALVEGQHSELFSLVEIKGEDGKIVRKDATYNKQYLEGRYGADPYFTSMTGWR